MRLEEAIDARLACDQDVDCFWWAGKWFSKKDFSDLTDICVANLRASGFSAGQRLCVLTQNSPMIPALSLAVWRLGGTFCPLNVKSGSASLSGTLALIEPFAVVLPPGIDEETVALLQDGGFHYAVCQPEGPLPRIVGRPSEIVSPDTAVIFATSGTTGQPKAVPLSHDNIHSNCLGIKEIIRPLAKGDVFLNVLPSFHSFGYTISTILPLLMDAKQAIVPGFIPPQQTMRAIVDASVNVLFGVPAIFSHLLSAVERGSMPREALANMKALISGGDRLDEALHEQSLRVIGKDIMEGYGLTEASPGVAISRSYEEYRPGTVGPFLEGYQWQLRGENGVATNEREGVLWIKSPSVTSGYFRSPEMTAERFEDGWFNTGDYVQVEDDGYVRVLGRITDIIIVGGFNVHPQEVEALLRTHPAVVTAIVVGMPHRVNGEIPKAYIQKAEGADLSEREVIAYCKKKLAHYMVPRKVEFVDNFPLSPTGKILRRVLRERTQTAGD